MATTPEGAVKRDVRKMLHVFEPDACWFMPATGGYGTSGAGDFVVCAWGQYLEIECKAGYNQPTALQNKHADAVRAAGGHYLVINEQNISTLGMLLAAWKGKYGGQTRDDGHSDDSGHADRADEDTPPGVLQRGEPRIRGR